MTLNGLVTKRTFTKLICLGDTVFACVKHYHQLSDHRDDFRLAVTKLVVIPKMNPSNASICLSISLNRNQYQTMIRYCEAIHGARSRGGLL